MYMYIFVYACTCIQHYYFRLRFIWMKLFFFSECVVMDTVKECPYSCYFATWYLVLNWYWSLSKARHTAARRSNKSTVICCNFEDNWSVMNNTGGKCFKISVFQFAFSFRSKWQILSVQRHLTAGCLLNNDDVLRSNCFYGSIVAFSADNAVPVITER